MKVLRGGKADSVRTRPVKGLKGEFSMTPEAGEGDYQSSEFFVPSHDAQGHASKVMTMVPPPVKREIQTILVKNIIPLWSTEGDLIRWCIVLGLKTLMKRVKDPDVKNAHAVMNSWVELQKETMETTHWGEVIFPRMKAELASRVKGGHYIPAKRLLRVIKSSIDSIGDDYWRAKFQRDLLDHYRWVEVKARAQEKRLKEGKRLGMEEDEEE